MCSSRTQNSAIQHSLMWTDFTNYIVNGDDGMGRKGTCGISGFTFPHWGSRIAAPWTWLTGVVQELNSFSIPLCTLQTTNTWAGKLLIIPLHGYRVVCRSEEPNLIWGEEGLAHLQSFVVMLLFGLYHCDGRDIEATT